MKVSIKMPDAPVEVKLQFETISEAHNFRAILVHFGASGPLSWETQAIATQIKEELDKELF